MRPTDSMGKRNLSKRIREVALPVKFTLRADMTIEEALHFLRSKHIDDRIVYFYVVDHEEKLAGVLATRSMMLRDPQTAISEVMQSKVICLQEDQTMQEAMEILEAHRLLALPVVDRDKRLIGMIDVDLYVGESCDVNLSRRRNEIFQMIGMYIEEEKLLSVWKSYRNRMPWIFCNMFGGIACAIISYVYQAVLAQVLLLAMFIPLVLTLSESISMQSMTQSLQMLYRRKLDWGYVFLRVLREAKVVTLIALSSGVIVGGLSIFWREGLLPALCITIGISISVVLSALIGSIVPLILHSKSWDPKVSSGPVVLMAADVLTTAIYLGLSTFILLKASIT